jgi:aldose 1-epimerase
MDGEEAALLMLQCSADTAVVTLRCSELEAQLLPSLGARIGRLRRHCSDAAPFDYLVPVEPRGFELQRWQRAGCFPMLPFTNRFARNTLAWHDAAIEVAAPDASALLHGWGLRSAWQVESVSATRCAMTHSLDATTAWPWRYRAHLAIDLHADGVALTLTVLNESREPMPLGVGFHPYFALNGTVGASARATARWHADEDSNGLPRQRESLAGPLRVDLKPDALPAETFTWFCECDAPAQAVIDYPDAGRQITLTSLQAHHFVVHHRAGERFLCIEPCTHLAGRLDPAQHIALPHAPATFHMHLQLR